MPIERKKGKAEAPVSKTKQDSFDEPNPHLAPEEPVASEESITKTLGNTDQNKCRDNVKDVIMFGDDLFKLMSKASSDKEGWMKSTKAMDTGKGAVIQVTTQQRNPDGSYAVAEAVTFVPGVTVIEVVDTDGNITGRRLKGVR